MIFMVVMVMGANDVGGGLDGGKEMEGETSYEGILGMIQDKR